MLTIEQVKGLKGGDWFWIQNEDTAARVQFLYIDRDMLCVDCPTERFPLLYFEDYGHSWKAYNSEEELEDDQRIELIKNARAYGARRMYSAFLEFICAHPTATVDDVQALLRRALVAIQEE